MPSYSMRNKFGYGEINHEEGLLGTNFIVSNACIQLYAEALGWANKNKHKITTEPFIADNIIVQGCQRTELTVLEAFKQIEYYKNQYPTKTIYLTGCLAKRFDIPIPPKIKRLAPIRSDGQYIKDFHLVIRGRQQLNWDQLFGGYYPLRIGRGGGKPTGQCNGRALRPGISLLDNPYSRRRNRETEMFHTDKPILVVADRPTPEQMYQWLRIAIFDDKPIAICNIEVEDAVLPFVEESFLSAARCKCLSGFHCRLRSTHPEILSHYEVSVSKVQRLLQLVEKLKKLGVFCAADVVIDFKWVRDDGMKKVKALFDAVRWEPYWAGKWTRRTAEAKRTLYSPHDFDWINR